MMDFDGVRAAYPHLAMSIYAQTPGGPVTFECITPGGDVFSFAGQTALAAMAEAFPEEFAEPMPSAPPTPPTTNVFD